MQAYATEIFLCTCFQFRNNFVPHVSFLGLPQQCQVVVLLKLLITFRFGVIFWLLLFTILLLLLVIADESTQLYGGASHD